MVAVTKKKIAFYSVLCTGHLNVCKSIAKALLDNYSDKIDIYFIVDVLWAEKLREFDSRFKFAIISSSKEAESRIEDLVDKLEPFLSLPLVDRMIESWKNFLDWNVIPEIDRKSEEKIREIGADLLICDQVCYLPAILNCKIPYGNRKRLFSLSLS